MRKYKNIKCEYNGIKFDSKKEMYRYIDLLCREKMGEISDLELQPKFDFIIEGLTKKQDKKIFTYKADFSYYEKDNNFPTIEDVKGFKTPVYRLKKKLIEAQFGITIKET